MKCGETVLLCDDGDPDSPPHLHIAITDANADGCVVLVSVTTLRARSDTMTVLQTREHPSIGHPSVITYAYSKLLRCSDIESLIVSGDAWRKADASPSIVQRAQAGMLETDRAPREIKQFFADWWEQHGTTK
jgi:hypothetical protein